MTKSKRCFNIRTLLLILMIPALVLGLILALPTSQASATRPTTTPTATPTPTPAPLGITTTSLPDGTVGVAYSYTLTATGGNGNYYWDLQSGSLPDGLSMTDIGKPCGGSHHYYDGNISGTPTTSGTFTFTVRVGDCVDTQATKSLSITINPAASGSLTSVSDTLTSYTGGATADHTIYFTTQHAIPDEDGGGKIEVTFPSGFDLSGVRSVTLEYLDDDYADDWDGIDISTAISGQTLTIIKTDHGAITKGTQLRVKINHIVNSGSCEIYTLNIATKHHHSDKDDIIDTGSCNIRIINCAPVTYNLTTSTIGSGNVATNTSNPHNSGSVVQLTATPANSCWTFTGWSGDLTGSTNPTTITMDSNKSVTATFAIDTYTLTYTAEGHGSITGDASQTVNCGSSGTQVTAVPADCYHFVNWSDGVTTASRTDSKATEVSASFAIDTYTLTYTAGEHGSITGDTSQTVNCGSSGTEVTAVPADCYYFVSWSDGVTTASRTDSKATEVSASFAIDTYTLTYTAGEHGSITGDTSQTVNCGTSGTQVTAVPADCYYFVSWSDGVTTASRTDSKATAVSASFAIDTYTITVTQSDNGTISPDTTSVNCGVDQSFTISAADCYHVADVSVDGKSVDAVASYKFEDVTTNHTITANFAINTYTVTVTQADNGTISPDTTSVNCGDDKTFTVSPAECYHVDSVLVDGQPASLARDGTYTFSDVTANHTITANFAINTYTLTYTAGEHGSITGYASQTVNCGTSGTQVTAVPADCYHFVSWSDGVTTASRTDSEDTNVTANFAIDTYTLTYSAGSGGSIDGTTSQTVNCGVSGTEVTATADSCHTFTSWSDGITTASRTDSKATAVSASFAIDTYTITASAGTGGNISPSGAVSVNCGDNQSFTITPDTYSHVADLSVDGEPAGAVTSYKFENVTASHTITVTFAHEVHYNINGSTGTWNLSSSGVLLEDVIAWSPAKEVYVNISAGATLLGPDGGPIDDFSASALDPLPDPPEGSHVLAAFDFEPDGATFSSGIEITIAFNSSAVPAGKKVQIAFYNESAGSWQYITGTVTNGRATFTVYHFTTYGLLTISSSGGGGGGGGSAVPTVEATATAEPTSTPAATPTLTPTATPTSTPTSTPTATPTPTPTPIELQINMWDKNGLAENWFIDNQGYLLEDVDATSLDGTMTINIPKDTNVLDSAGNPLTQISVALIAPPATAPEGYKILKSFDFNPDGAQFDPCMKVTISFDPATVPEGQTVALAFYNEAKGKWEFVSGTNNGDGTATFELTHFSAYSLMFRNTQYTSAFKDSIPLPRDLSSDPTVIGTNLLFALLLVLLFYIASTLFNSTLKENYETIHGWLTRPFKRSSKPHTDGAHRSHKGVGRFLLEGFGVVFITALLSCFLDPHFTDGSIGLILFIGITVAISLLTFFYEGIQILLSKYRFRVPAVLKIHPIAMLLAVVFVIISRAVHFYPGLIFGFVGACVPLLTSRRLNTRQDGISILLSSLSLAIICCIAFFVRAPVEDAIAAHNSFGLELVSMILAAIFAIGLEGLLFNLLPLTFVDGERLAKWNKAAWLVTFTIVVFLFYHIIINRNMQFEDAIGDLKVQMMFVITIVFLVLSVIVWLAFRLRHRIEARNGLGVEHN